MELLKAYNRSEIEFLDLLDETILIVEKNSVLDLLSILANSKKTLIKNACLNCLYYNLLNINSFLLEIYQEQETSEITKFNIIDILCKKPLLQNANFLITEYLAKKHLRPHIEKGYFKDQAFALLCFSNYLESHSLTLVEENIIIKFLARIELAVFGLAKDHISNLKIADLFYLSREITP